MSVDKIRSALGALLSDPENHSAWEQIEEVITGQGGEDLARELERGRVEQERLHAWSAAAKLLDYELAVAQGEQVRAAKQLELGRIYYDELCQSSEALRAYKNALEARGDDPKAKAAVAEITSNREKWEELVEQHLVDALETDDDKQRARLLVSAADVTLRYAARSPEILAKVSEYLRQALKADPDNRRGLILAALVYEKLDRYPDLASVLERMSAVVPAKTDKIAAATRLARLYRRKISDPKQAVAAHTALLDLDPSNNTALSFLVDHFTQHEEWDRLVALYEDQLGSGAVKQADEFGVWVQIAMLNWRTLERPDAAETYFDKVRRADPTHVGMLRFFRERCGQKGDTARLSAILIDAQRATNDEELKRKLAEEIAGLAEGQENAKRAIDQYKTILRTDPNDAEAREKLKKLYLQTESYNALVELHRQDLQRIPKEAVQQRIGVLREMAVIYRDRMKSDTALLTVLTQILQHDEKDVQAVRGLISVYEALQRWRDLLNMQQKLADITDSQAERVSLLRAVARRWLEQFSNVQNAIVSYEALLDATGDDVEAREQLRDLYQKRRAWPKLYELFEKQLAHCEGEKRVDVLQQMAKLAAERLDKGDEAIRLLRQVYQEAPASDGVLDQLEKQAERQKDFKTAAFVLEERVKTADDDKRLALLQKLGALQAEKLEDHQAANQTWRRVLELSPGHNRALRVLRQAFVDAGDWDGLEELYASQKDWEGLADFLSTTADKHEENDEKIELSFRAARTYEENLTAPERAARSYERVLSVAAAGDSHVRAANALLPIYEREEKWSRLPGLHQIIFDATSDVDERIGILQKMASITGGQLANKTAALQYARRAYELRPDDQGLRRLQEWSQQSGEWTIFIDVVKERLAAATDEAKSRELKNMLAEVYANQSGKIDEAVAIYRELVEADPNDKDTVATFDRLLRGADRKEELRWLFGLKVERFVGEARIEALEEWASVEQDVFGEPARAIDLLEKVVEEEPRRIEALTELTSLLLASEKWDDAVAVMLVHRDASAGDERASLEGKLAGLYLDRLGARVEAFQACLRAMDIDPQHTDAVVLLEKLIEPPEQDNREAGDVRAKAAEVLERYYADQTMPGKRVLALKVMLEHEESGDRRLELCARLADVLEEDLDDKLGAFEVVLNTLLEAPKDLALWDRARRLAASAGRPTDLSQAYRRHVGDLRAAEQAALPEELRIELCERAAALHEEQLGDAEGAIPYLRQVLTIDAKNEQAFGRLKAILNGAERWEELEDLYRRAIDAARDDRDRIETLSQAALLAEEMIGDDGKAIDYYERIVALDALHDSAIDALERLYGREERYDDLTQLLEKRLETATDDEAVPIRLQLCELYLHALKRHDRVMGHLEAVLGHRHEENEARELAEECLAVDELRHAAAQLLDGVYEARDDIRDLVRVLLVRLEGAKDDEQKRELLRRLATLRDERMKDDAGSFESLQSLVPLEPEDATVRERFMLIGRRLGAHGKMAEALGEAAQRCQLPQVRGEILMASARLYRDDLDQSMRAEKVFKQVLEIDADDPLLVIPAAQALAEIYEERADHDKLASTLNTQVRLVSDTKDRAELFERIALLYEEAIDDKAKAIDAWKSRLADDAGDEVALKALERLYEQTEQWGELASVLHLLEEAAQDADERKRCMVKGAAIHSEKLGRVNEAINAWRAVVDDFGPEPAALAPLADLYEKAERWDDLADVLDVWLSLVSESAEQVDLYARLGNVRREHLADPREALQAYREVLERNEGHKGARAALEALLAHEEAEIRCQAAEIMGPLYRAEGDAERLLKVLDIEVESTDEPQGKLELLQRALDTAEDVLESPSRAFDYAARGVREAVGDSTIERWIGTADRLAAATDRWSDLLALFEAVIEDLLDADVQQNTRRRAGEIARTMLEDNERAIRHFRAALDARGDDRDAMIALEELYLVTVDDPNLLEILVLRAESESDAAKAALLLRAAKLQAGPLGDRAGAIRTYEDVLAIELHPEATTALESLYRDEKQFESLMRMLESQLDVAEGKSTAEIRVKMAQLAHEHLSDTARALDELDAALEVDAMHAGAVAVLESLLDKLEEADLKAHVAKTLEPIYRSTANSQKLKGVLEALVETSQDPTERGVLLEKLAQHYEEQLEDYPMALETVARRLRDEPGDEQIWEKIESLGRVIGAGADLRIAEIFSSALQDVGADDPKTAELCRKTGELFAMASKREESLKWYRRAHQFSPDSDDLFEAIDGLLIELERKEERVEHHQAGVDQALDGERRVRHLHVIAKLQRELGRNDEAIGTLEELKTQAPDDGSALDMLTQLYKEGGHDDRLAELYEARAEAAAGPEESAEYRLLLAKLWAKRPDDRDRAVEQLDIILQALPSHQEAIAELESFLDDAERKERVVELLRPIYGANDDWKKLCALNEHRVGLSDDPNEKTAILLESAILWEDRGDDLKRAFTVVTQAFQLSPEHEEARAHLERLAEATESWDALARAYEAAASQLDDAFAKRQLLSLVANIADQRLDDPRRSLAALAEVAVLDPSDDEALERMDDLCVLLGDWATLARVLANKTEYVADADEKARVLQRLAEIRQDMLGDEDGAIEGYERVLDLFSDSLPALDRLIGLYRGRDPKRLVELCEQRIEATQDDDATKHELTVSAAEVYEKELERSTDAIRMLQLAIEMEPTDTAVLASLERLYRSEERWPDLLENLKTQASITADPVVRRELRNRIGDLCLEKLDASVDALDQYRLVLEESPDDAHAIRAARAIADKHSDLRLDVTSLLQPIYANAGRFDDLIELMEVRIGAQTDPAERAQSLIGVARIQEEQLEAPEKARDTSLRALVEIYREGPPADAQLHEDVERLCELTGAWGSYADVLEKMAGDAYDGTAQRDLYQRLGRIAETKLDDPARAIDAYKKAAEQTETPGELLVSLDRLYLATNDFDRLAGVLERRIESETSDSERAQLHYRLAKLHLDHFDDKPAAVERLKRCAEIDPEHAGARQRLEELTAERALFEEVAEALDAMYRVAQDSAGRARLRNKRIDYADTAAERVRLRMDLAQMLEDESFDTASAQEVIQQALVDDPTDPEVMQRLAALAATNAAGTDGPRAWRKAADAVRDAVAKAVANRDKAADGEIAADVARDSYLTVASWYEEHVADAAQAEKSILAALEQDPRCAEAVLRLESLHRAAGRERDLVATLRKLADLVQSGDAVLDREHGALRREAKILAETVLEDRALVESILREMLSAYDADPWALAELSRVCEEKRDFDELLKLLLRRIELTPDASPLRELRHQAAKVAQELGDSGQAVDLYEQAFDDDPSDGDAASELRRLYEKLGRNEDTLRLIERLVDLTDDTGKRAKLRLDSARICLELLEAPTEAIEHLNAVLTESPGEPQAVALLSGLLEKEGRDKELAELLERQIDLAREQGDKPAELGLRVKYSELCETRLNDIDRAIDGYLAVLQTDAGYRPALEALARLYEGQGKQADAAETYEKLLAGATGGDAVRLAFKARDLYAGVDGSEESACRVLESALRAKGLGNEDVGQLRDALESLYRARGAWQQLAELTTMRADEAEDVAERVLLYRQAAQIHAGERKDHGAAAELLERALELQKDNRDLMLALCDAYTAANRGDSAIAVLNKIVESYGGRRSKDLADIHTRIASAYMSKGDGDAALRELEAARKMDAANVKVAADLGRLSIEMYDSATDDASKADHLKRADSVFKSLLLQKIDDSSPISKAEVFYGVALVAKRMNDPKKAISNLERALGADKDFTKAKLLLDELKG
jgi:tetratricopeptide (TPR) repeat protein